MDELDFLKSHWQKDDQFPQVKAEEIRRMRHRSSSSIVKWIFIISVLELFILGILPLFFFSDERSDSRVLEIVYIVSDIIFYPVILYFIYRFFTSFVRIKNTTDTKTLMKTILDCRKHVHHYIKFNLYFIFIGFVVIAAAQGYERANTEPSIGGVILVVILWLVVTSIIGLLFMWLVRLYYRLLYGILLGKLSKNYEELLALERGVEQEG